MEVFQIKDLTANVLPGRGVLLGPNCRISADPGPECAPRSAGPKPRHPREPNPPRPIIPDPLCADSRQLSAACEEHDHGPRRAAGLDALRRELRAAIGPA
jgi:hypothetical protein